MKPMPKEISIAIVAVGGLVVDIEHDGVNVRAIQLGAGNIDNSDVVMDSIQGTLESLGYKPDPNRSYQDMSLLKRYFYLDEETKSGA